MFLVVQPVRLHQHTRAARARKSADMVSANMVFILPKVLNKNKAMQINDKTKQIKPTTITNNKHTQTTKLNYQKPEPGPGEARHEPGAGKPQGSCGQDQGRAVRDMQRGPDHPEGIDISR